VTVFVDTAVIMYASGAAHRLKRPCADILRMVAGGSLDAVISAEVIQEIAHRFMFIRRPEMAADLAASALELFAPVMPIGHTVVARLPGLIIRYPKLQARDLIHVATCLEERIETIVSPDLAFDQVAELQRIDPTDVAALASGA
jgi:predicted nucleic acid-binding protein